MGLFDHLYHLDWTARYPLQYYYQDGRHVIFDKYEINMFGEIYNIKTKQRVKYDKIGFYDIVTIYNLKNKDCQIRVARAVASTFHGKPPTPLHTTEHIDCANKNNDIVSELTWIDIQGQNKNRIMPEEQLSAYIIVREDLEMTTKKWICYLKDEKNPYGREYTKNMIHDYAQKKKHGFSYKVYDDLPNETWYKISNSENSQGHWEISDHNRIARISKYARNVIDVTRFGLDRKYPRILINGRICYLHVIAFETYYPELYNHMKPGEMILHKFDDKIDFRPHMLYIGDSSKNSTDAHDNGCYDDTKRSRVSCCSYINGVLEKRHESQDDAVKYLRANGYPRAARSSISDALKALKDYNKVLVRYDRTWSFKS